MSTRKDFAGINICVYDPIEGDSGSFGENTNTFGYADSTSAPWYTDAAGTNNNSSLTSHSDKNTLVLLNLHRNGAWGYSSWKQLRVGQNPLTRNQIKNSVYSYVPACDLEEIRNVPPPTQFFAQGAIQLPYFDSWIQQDIHTNEIGIRDSRGYELTIEFRDQTVHADNAAFVGWLNNYSNWNTAGAPSNIGIEIAYGDILYSNNPSLVNARDLAIRVRHAIIKAIEFGFVSLEFTQTFGITSAGQPIINLNLTSVESGIIGNQLVIPPTPTSGFAMLAYGNNTGSPAYQPVITPFAGGKPPEPVPANSFMHKKRYCDLEYKTEPMLSSKYAPLQYNFGYMMKDGRMAEFTLKADLTNECRFFTHDRMTDLFASRPLTTEDYEQAKVMYLDNALNNSHNPIDSIELIKYRETVYPRESNTFLSISKQRDTYVSGYWRDVRSLRKYPIGREHGVTYPLGSKYSIYGELNSRFLVNPSSWPLDPRDDYYTRATDMIIGCNGGAEKEVYGATSTGTNHGIEDGSGILQNSVSQFGYIDQQGQGSNTNTSTAQKNTSQLLDAPTYFRRQTTLFTSSLSFPSGIDLTGLPVGTYAMFSSSLSFRGDTTWDAGSQRETFTTSREGKRTYSSNPRNPFADTYQKYSEYLRLVGKDYSVIPEFNISENIDFYKNTGAAAKNLNILSIKGPEGAPVYPDSVASNTQCISPNTLSPSIESQSPDFYETYSNTDFFKMFDIIEEDNKDTLKPSVLKLTCKALKKFLPHNGFYPATRTVQIANQFFSSYGDYIRTTNGVSQVLYDATGSPLYTAAQTSPLTSPPAPEPARVNLSNATTWTTGFAKWKPINSSLFSPGILFNTIKAGMAMDWPNITSTTGESCHASVDNGTPAATQTEDLTYIEAHTGSYTTMVGEHRNYAQTAGLIKTDYCLVRKANVTAMIPNQHSSHYVFHGVDEYPYFDNRIPFEALVNPTQHMSSFDICDLEPHPYGNTGLINKLEGESDDKYRLMINNFLAETPRFFLKRKEFTTLKSLRQGDPKFGNVKDSGALYGMRIKVKRSMQTPPSTRETEQTKRSIYLPQDDTSAKENFTMYSRPQAFGPPTCGISPPITARRDEPTYADPHSMLADDYNHIQGYNFPFAPIYSHGEAWMDILFLPSQISNFDGKATIEQIFDTCRYFELRFWQGNDNEFGTKLQPNGYANTYTGSNIPVATIQNIVKGEFQSYRGNGAHPNYPASGYTDSDINTSKSSTGNAHITAGFQFSLHAEDGVMDTPINKNAMQISSCFNTFVKAGSKNDVSSFNLGPIQINTNVDSDEDARWVIQSKFESPMLNFNHYEPGQSSNWPSPPPGPPPASLLPDYLKPRGLWHQYGRIPEENEGVTIEITDIPKQWWLETYDNIYMKSWNARHPGASTPVLTSTTPLSLADLVGFPKGQPVKLGELAERTTIKEAVVAIPFKSVKGRRKYFKIDRANIIDSLKILNGNKESEDTIGKSIIDQVRSMREYVFPPELDFLSDNNIDPFAMYIFEFKQELSKQDLSDIWQNILPDIGVSMEFAESEISHELLSNELLGTQRKLSNASRLIKDDKQSLFDSEIRWMVFKVKQKANKSYNNLMLGNEKEEVDLCYNWPYDYFSLVELVKIEAEVELSDIQEDQDSRKPKKITSKRFRAQDIDLDGDS